MNHTAWKWLLAASLSLNLGIIAVVLFHQARPQRAGIDAEQARIAALQYAQQQRVIAQLLAERELLDEPQRAKLQDLLLSRYAQEATQEELLHRD